MLDIYVYTPDFNLLHMESKVTSVQWHLKYNDAGTVEMHTDTENDIVNKILPSANSDVIIVQGNNAAWLSGLTDITDNYDFGVFGKTLNYMLNWRIVNPFSATDTTENIIRQKVIEQFMTSGNKKIDNFILGSVIGGTSTVTYGFEDKQKTLFEVVQELCSIDNLGFKIDFDTDNEKFVFNIYRGIDRTADQTARPALIFSEDEKNISDLQYTYMQQDYYSTGYYEQKDEETEIVSYIEVSKDDVTGFKRREKILKAKTAEEGKIELDADNKIEQIEGEIRNIKYEKDYYLGDIVTVQKKIGDTLIVQNKRIVEVVQVHEPLNSYEKPILENEVI